MVGALGGVGVGCHTAPAALHIKTHLDSSNFEIDVVELENHAITSSVVFPIHCLKLDADTAHS